MSVDEEKIKSPKTEDVVRDRSKANDKSKKKKHSHRKSSTKVKDKLIKPSERGEDEEEEEEEEHKERRSSNNYQRKKRHSHRKVSSGKNKDRLQQSNNETTPMEVDGGGEEDDVHKKVPSGDEQSPKEEVNEEEAEQENEAVQIMNAKVTAEDEAEKEPETAAEEEGGGGRFLGSGGEFLRDKVTFDWQNQEDPLGLGVEKEETNTEKAEKETTITTTDGQNDIQSIQKLFGIVKPSTTTERPLSKVDFTDYKQLQEDELREEQKRLLAPSDDDVFTDQKSWRRRREWIVHCRKKSSKRKSNGNDENPTIFAVVTLSPQVSLDDFTNNEIPLHVKISEVDQAWGLLGSVKALRGSAVPSVSAVPSRFTTQSTVTSRYSQGVRALSDVSFTESGCTQEEHNFDLADEPIWQRGRHFDFGHPTDPHKKHFIIIINTLNDDLKIMEATQATLLHEVKERYRRYNANIDNYRWKDVYEKPLHFHLTLHENGLVDNSYITDEIGLDYYPLILLFFDDGFENDPPMQLDIRKAFIRDADILCRNYQLGLVDSNDNNYNKRKHSREIGHGEFCTF